jgi:hypothetical protein
MNKSIQTKHSKHTSGNDSKTQTSHGAKDNKLLFSLRYHKRKKDNFIISHTLNGTQQLEKQITNARHVKGFFGRATKFSCHFSSIMFYFYGSLVQL